MRQRTTRYFATLATLSFHVAFIAAAKATEPARTARTLTWSDCVEHNGSSSGTQDGGDCWIPIAQCSAEGGVYKREYDGRISGCMLGHLVPEASPPKESAASDEAPERQSAPPPEAAPKPTLGDLPPPDEDALSAPPGHATSLPVARSGTSAASTNENVEPQPPIVKTRWNPILTQAAGIAAIGFGAAAIVVGAPVFVGGSIAAGVGLAAVGVASVLTGGTMLSLGTEALTSMVSSGLRHLFL